MDINLWLPRVTSIVRISPTISPLNATLRSQEKRKWLPTKDCWTKSPCQHLRKRIENNMEGIHTGVRVERVKPFFSLHIVHSLLTAQYELHVLVLQNLTHELLLCTSFDCVLKSCMCVCTFFNVLFTCILGQVSLSCAVPIVIWQRPLI